MRASATARPRDPVAQTGAGMLELLMPAQRGVTEGVDVEGAQPRRP